MLRRLRVFRQPSAFMQPPPWVLVSPSGVIHHVRNEQALKRLAESDTSLYSDLRKLVGLLMEKKTAQQLPQHKQQWQLLARVRWLQRCDNEELVAVIGDTEHFIREFAAFRDDMQLFDSSRLQQLLNKGWLWSNAEKVNEYIPKGSTVKWRRFSGQPAQAEFLLPCVPSPSEFARVSELHMLC
jgi:hypothetical protein